MTIRSSIVSLLGIGAVSFAGGLGCQHAQPSDSRAGTIDFVVRHRLGASATASGSFDVRGIDSDEHTRVGIGSGTARTLHVRLPAGAYAVAWDPTSPVDATRQARSELGRDAADQEWPQIVVVTADSASVVDVLVSAKSADAETSLQLASAGSRSAF